MVCFAQKMTVFPPSSNVTIIASNALPRQFGHMVAMLKFCRKMLSFREKKGLNNLDHYMCTNDLKLPVFSYHAMKNSVFSTLKAL